MSLIVLTHNEEANLPTCLESVRSLGCRIFVVDSGSADRTVEIAEAAGASVVFHPFETQAAQLNWALAHLPSTAEWVLRLDADEWVTPALAEELSAKLNALPADVTGLFIKRRVYFLGRWMRHGGYYPTWLLRAWRHGKAVCEDKLMDEHMVLLEGKPGRLEHDIVDENRKGLEFWIEKHNQFSTRWAKAHLMAQETDPGREVEPSLWASQEARKRWLKRNVYDRAPLFARAAAFWFYRYWLRFGFLDGKEGLIFHFLQGFWYRFLIDAKVYEARERLKPPA
ncbi:MAG: glycosyltransferase family 2 protein [Candidatus Tectomicrobia bacterium]|nr:glycosyltransferase family 2 protein [Candidatus Tectomicrobia bacterium]